MYIMKDSVQQLGRYLDVPTGMWLVLLDRSNAVLARLQYNAADHTSRVFFKAVLGQLYLFHLPCQSFGRKLPMMTADNEKLVAGSDW